MQSVKPEVQLQLNLTTWASWWILHIENNSQRSKKMLQRGRKWRKKRQGVDTQAQTVLTLGLDQITKFIYRLDGPLGEYSGLTQSMLRLDRVKSSSCDCPEKIHVDVDSNASCFTSFSSGSSSSRVLSNFALGLCYCLGLSHHLRTIQCV
jgi:hypothetical protein